MRVRRTAVALVSAIAILFGSLAFTTPASAAPSYPGIIMWQYIQNPHNPSQFCNFAAHLWDDYGHGGAAIYQGQCSTSNVLVEVAGAFGDAYNNYYVDTTNWLLYSQRFNQLISAFGYSALNACVRVYFLTPNPYISDWSCVIR